MSSILKALKKLEEETARREGNATDIARDILRIAPRRRQNVWLLPALVVTILFAVTCLYILLQQEEEVPTLREGVVAVEPANPPADSRLEHAQTDTPLPKRSNSAKDVAALVEKPSDKSIAPPPPPSDARTASPPATIHPNLIVNGIAYQEDRPSRMAIVNDLPVMEGTHVDLALVEEILPDRVVFSIDEKRFEVFLEPPQ